MKKLLAIFLCTVILIVFTGCGAMSKSMASYDLAAPAEAPEAVNGEYGYVSEEAFDSASGNTSVGEVKNTTGRKLIRNVTIEAETLDYENCVVTVQNKVAEFGGYIESSSLNNNSYYYSSYSAANRYANFTCRIPSNKLDSFLSTVDGIANVTYQSENQKDVTLSYVDTEARIASLQTEYDRLLELLAEAENIDTIILLEQRLSEVRYQLESYKSQLRTYDNLVDYSTVELNIREVHRQTASEPKNVWQRIGNDFSDNLYDVWVGIEDFFVWFISAIPYFVVIAIVIIIIVLIIKALLMKSPRYREKKALKKAEKERRKAEKAAQKAAKKAGNVAAAEEVAEEEAEENKE